MADGLQLIPVLDLMGGQVVRAYAGRRDEYRPLISVLCDSSHPLAVVRGLLELYPFGQIYIADLDAILGKGNHGSMIDALSRAYPKLEFWVDGGFGSVIAAQAWKDSGLGRPVLGSETMTNALENISFPEYSVLSLDYLGEKFLGPNSVLQDCGSWPRDVIIMTMDMIGTGRGPDLSRLKKMKKLAPTCHYYVAGGVRHMEDLTDLQNAGAAGVLLASALHDGVLNHAELVAFHAGHRLP